MKPTTVAGFMKGARDARHDALGLANDIEATMALACVHRNAFMRDRGEQSLRRWRELISQIATGPLPEDPAMFRWLAIEYVRLAHAFRVARVDDSGLNSEVARWSSKLDVNERKDELSRFELDMAAPIRGATAGSRG